MSYPITAWCFSADYTDASQTVVESYAASAFNYHYNYSTPENHTITYKVCLDAGTYTLRAYIAQNSQGGLCQLKVNGSDISTPFECYNATARAWSHDFTVTIATAGEQTIVFENAGSSDTGFRTNLCYFWIR